MGKITSKEIYVKASASKPTWKTPPGDKTPGLEPAIRFYAIKYSDKSEEW